MNTRILLLAAVILLGGPLHAASVPTPALVKDINPGAGDSSIASLTDLNGIVYFAATDGVHGSELWRSDGTTAGTVMVKDINAGAAGSQPDGFTPFNGRLIFSANDGAHGFEPWISDGTSAGTVLLKDLAAGTLSSAPGYFTVVGAKCFFVADSGGNGNNQLWVTDGTSSGTVQVTSIPWLPDGPDENHPTQLVDSGAGFLFFTGNDSVNGRALWRSDGTAGGTTVVKQIGAPSDQRGTQPWVAANGILYFVGSAGTGTSTFWRSDGTSAGTYALGANLAFPASLTMVDGQFVYFTAWDTTVGYELRYSDGTSNGTYLVKDILPGTSSEDWPSDLVAIQDKVFFSDSNGVNGYELWTSDGTAAGTVMVSDINAGAGSSYPSQLTVVGNLLYFTAFDGVNQGLWVSDGTPSGTSLVPGTTGISVDALTVSGTQKLFFTATDATHGRELWALSNLPPTIAVAASASPNPDAGTTADLFALGADDGGEAQLTYTWSLLNNTLKAPSIVPNGSNAAKSPLVTFQQAGTYTFQVSIADDFKAAITSQVTMTVTPTPTTLQVTPALMAINAGATAQFSASLLDQFGAPISPQPTVAWMISGGGTISASGLFTAGSASTSTAFIVAHAAGIFGEAQIQVLSAANLAEKINFQPDSAPTVVGYAIDDGSLYALRANGLTYGWSVNQTDYVRKRGVNANELLDTLNQFHVGSVWKMSVPNGSYAVKVGLGDPSNASTYTLNVNGVNFCSALPLGVNAFTTITKTVTVSNGLISVDQGAAGDKATRIDYLEITTANPANGYVVAISGNTILGVGDQSTIVVTLAGAAGSHAISLTNGATFSDGTTSKTQVGPSSVSYTIVGGPAAGGFAVDVDGDPMGPPGDDVTVTITDLPDRTTDPKHHCPAGIPTGVPTPVTVTVSGLPPVGGKVNLSVSKRDGRAGTADVAPAVITANGSYTVMVTGKEQSSPAGSLQFGAPALNWIQAQVGNGTKVFRNATAFSICNHPKAIKIGLTPAVTWEYPQYYGGTLMQQFLSDGIPDGSTEKPNQLLWVQVMERLPNTATVADQVPVVKALVSKCPGQANLPRHQHPQGSQGPHARECPLRLDQSRHPHHQPMPELHLRPVHRDGHFGAQWGTRHRVRCTGCHHRQRREASDHPAEELSAAGRRNLRRLDLQSGAGAGQFPGMEHPSMNAGHRRGSRILAAAARCALSMLALASSRGNRGAVREAGRGPGHPARGLAHLQRRCRPAAVALHQSAHRADGGIVVRRWAFRRRDRLDRA